MTWTTRELKRFFAFGMVFSWVCLLLMLTHRSEPATYFGRYSTSYLATLGVMVGACGLWSALTVVAFLQRLPAVQPQWYFAPVIWVALVVVWRSGYGTRFQPSIMLFLVYGLLNGLIVVVWSLQQVPFVHRRVLQVALVITVTLTVAMIATALTKVPASLIFDEAIATNWAVSLSTGKPILTMIPQYPASLAASVPFTFPLIGIFLKTFGITFENGRLAFLLVTGACLPFIFSVVKPLYGRLVGVIAVCLALALILPHNYIRQDGLVAVFLAVGLWAFWRGRTTQRLVWFFCAGFAFALCAEGHLLAVRYPIVMGILLTGDYILTIYRSKQWVWRRDYGAFVAGGVVGLGLWVVYHSLFWGISIAGMFGGLVGSYGVESNLGASAGSGIVRYGALLAQWLTEYLTRHPIEFVLFGVVMVWGVWQRQSFERWLAGLLIGSTLLLFVLSPKFSFNYYVHSLPLIVVLGCGLLDALSRHARAPQTALAVLGIAIIGLQLAQVSLASTTTQNANRAFEQSYAMNARLPASVERVLGWQTYYFGLSQRQFVATEAYIKDTPEAIAQQSGVQVPQAVILTSALDDQHALINAYVQAQKMVVWGCFDVGIAGGTATLYVLPSFGQAPSPTPCSP